MQKPGVEDLSAHTERILQKMDEQGISNRKLRRSVEKVKTSPFRNWCRTRGIWKS
ncbi:MAG: hypothetical protein V8R52_13695 [Coprobacter fastidiosus]